MSSSIGQTLRQTREKRGIAIDEVAHATKLRPEQITALEIGDYGSFPSSSYARGFLKIYGRYLRIDVTAEAATLATESPISIEDYQYLSIPNEIPREPERNLPDLSLARRSKPSLVPLLVSAAVVALVIFGFSTYVNWQRISGDHGHKTADAATEPTAIAPAETAPDLDSPPASLPTEAAPALAAAAADPAPGPTAPPATLAATAEPIPVDAAPRGPGVMAVDREFLGEPPATSTRAPGPAEPLPPVPNPDRDVVAPQIVAVNEVEVSVARKTWVTIRREDHDASPLFEDYLYPGVRPLKLKGTRFIIEARDPGVVEIRKNGAPIAYQRPGVTVQ